MIVTPTEYLRKKLEPISQEIDGFGGYNLMIGFIAAGGEPHIFITGNLNDQPTLAKEIYEALSDKLRSMASGNSNIIQMPGA